MKIKINIDSDNDACQTLEDAHWLLSTITKRVMYGESGGIVKDINGNKVGTFLIEDFQEEEEEE